MSEQQLETQNYSSRPHVLVIDDDARIRDLVLRFLKEQGFVVMTAQSASDARDMLGNFEFDVLVVDVMMPEESGLEFTRSLRDSDDSLPVLLLTALGETENRIEGLEAGADDYLPKPFEPRELVLRLNAILRRSAVKYDEAQTLKIGRWHFDPEEGVLSCGEEVQPLTDVENTLLSALADKPGEVMSREELAKKCSTEGGERTIDVQVTRLRRKIEDDSRRPRYLKTVRGKGYLLRVEEL